MQASCATPPRGLPLVVRLCLVSPWFIRSVIIIILTLITVWVILVVICLTGHLWRLDYILGLSCDGILDLTIVEAVPDFVLDCAADYLFECLKWVADSLLALLEVNN